MTGAVSIIYFRIFAPNPLIMTEKEKMLAGMVYSAVDEQLLDELNAVKAVIH